MGHEFLAILKSQGAERCAEMLRKERQANPDYVPFAAAEIGPLFEDLLEQGRAAEAAQAAELWAIVQPDDVGPLYSAARAYEQLEDAEMVERTRRRILEIEPQAVTAGRMPAEATQMSPEENALRPDRADLPSERELWDLMRTGRMDEARRIVTEIMERQPDVRLGRIYEATGDRERAIAHYREALRRQPGIPPVLEALERLGVTPEEPPRE